MSELIWTTAAAFLLLIGAGFMLIAALGVLRMPDLMLRLQAGTKASTLGIACTALGAAAHFRDAETTITAGLVITFFLLTAPVAGHIIGRAAYLTGIRLLPETRDEWGQHGEPEHSSDGREF